jgi:hypothetical protein
MTSSLLSRTEAQANATLDALRKASGNPILPGMTGADLLHERVALMQWRVQSQRSANGSCHLLRCMDGWLAINLSRETDWHLLPALLEEALAIDTIEQLQMQMHTRSTRTMVERGAVLGLALAEASRLPPTTTTHRDPVLYRGKTRAPHGAAPLVIDLSTLWAGPLCSQLLQQAGAHVVEIHNLARPDGMAMKTAPGAQEFYRRLHNGKERCTLDLRKSEDIAALQVMLDNADIVIESSRARALQQLGIDAEQRVTKQAGLVWVSITGYGRQGDVANRIAFGDDAAVGAGLFDEIDGKPVFIGDAIADPLTGLHAALAARRHWKQGEAVLLDINLHSVAAQAALA